MSSNTRTPERYQCAKCGMQSEDSTTVITHSVKDHGPVQEMVMVKMKCDEKWRQMGWSSSGIKTRMDQGCIPYIKGIDLAFLEAKSGTSICKIKLYIICYVV